jgi:hypothetical protein
MLLHEYAENKRKHRDRTFIVADILRAVRKGILKTRAREIMYRVGVTLHNRPSTYASSSDWASLKSPQNVESQPTRQLRRECVT